MNKKKKKTKEEIDREVDAEFEAMTKEEALAQFDKSRQLYVPAKKTGNSLLLELPRKSPELHLDKS